MSTNPDKEEIINTIKGMDISNILNEIEILSHFPKSRKRLEGFRSTIEEIYIYLATEVLKDEK